jgi:Ca2+-binding EF-hand superfamily protein
MNGRRVLLGLPLLVGCLWAAGSGEGASSKPSASAKEVQDVVFLAEGRPILIRMRVRVDGKPYQEVWEQFIDRVFRYLDVNKDGVLSKEEAERAPPVAALFSSGFFGGSPPVMRMLDANRDGKVSKQELADYYRRSGAAPFQFGGAGGSRQPRLFGLANGSALGGGRPGADELNKRLFELLDTNKDGKLSRKELEAAPAVLAKLDENDDEMIEVAELTPGPRAGMYEQVVLVGGFDGGAPSGGNSQFRLVSADRPDPALARQLLAKYGKGAKKLGRKALGLSKEAFDALDADGDGELDAEELARFARRAPDLEVRVGVGGAVPGGPRLRRVKKGADVAVTVDVSNGPAGGSTVELVKGVGDPSLTRRVKPARGGGLVLDLGNTRVEFGKLGQVGGNTFVFNTRQQYLAQFKAADRDGNGYLDVAEARASPLFRNLFKLMDRDGDGKLFRKEVIAFLEEMEALQRAATASCVSMRVSDEGKGLFDLLDKDGDGRLSVRELRELPKLVERLDADGDGQVSLSEIPRSYRVSVTRGPANSGGYGRQFIAFAPGVGMPPRPAPARTRGPLWFRKMDRNRDGDVSRREFLGTDEEFRKIDADGDGLISAEEAERYDKEVRKAKATGK